MSDETGPDLTALRKDLANALPLSVLIRGDRDQILGRILPVVARDRARQEQKITEDKPGSALTLGCRPCKECAEKLAKITEMRALHTFDGINGCDKCGEMWPCETVRILDGEMK